MAAAARGRTAARYRRDCSTYCRFGIDVRCPLIRNSSGCAGARRLRSRTPGSACARPGSETAIGVSERLSSKTSCPSPPRCLPAAAAVRSQPLVMETQRRDVLADLDRRRRDVGWPRQARQSIAAARCRPCRHCRRTCWRRACRRPHARLVHAPHRRAARRHHPFGHDLAEAAEHQHRQVMSNQHARAARRREYRIDDASRPARSRRSAARRLRCSAGQGWCRP